MCSTAGGALERARGRHLFLCRAELTPAQRAAAIRRRKQIWEALHPVGGTICSTQPATAHKDRPQNQQQFAAETAAISGQSKQDINRHLSRAAALGDDLQAVAGNCAASPGVVDPYISIR
ncbi:MAG: hypothetical protein K8F56_05815 [Rhodocyclaceae bacterium]|nr:hypothetical protein [Rhodocyclaceae bacterium]